MHIKTLFNSKAFQVRPSTTSLALLFYFLLFIVGEVLVDLVAVEVLEVLVVTEDEGELVGIN